MTALTYNLAMGAGLAITTAGAALLGGLPAALLTCGVLLIAATAFTAVLVR